MIVKVRAVKSSAPREGESRWGGWEWIGDVQRVQVLGRNESHGSANIQDCFSHNCFHGFGSRADLNNVHEFGSALFDGPEGYCHVWLTHSDGRIELMGLGLGSEAYLLNDKGDTVERIEV